MFKMYAIPNCDTVKKARDFLAEKKISYEFIDFKKNKPTAEDIKRWSTAFQGLPVNVKGTTFKKYKVEFEALSDQEKITFIQEHASMIKRPIIEKNGKVLTFGFDPQVFTELFSN